MYILKDEISGLFYFEKLPKNFRIAKPKDFEDLEMAIDKMKPFLIYGFIWQFYICYRVNEFFKLTNIKYWMDRERVFVMN